MSKSIENQFDELEFSNEPYSMYDVAVTAKDFKTKMKLKEINKTHMIFEETIEMNMNTEPLKDKSLKIFKKETS